MLGTRGEGGVVVIDDVVEGREAAVVEASLPEPVRYRPAWLDVAARALRIAGEELASTIRGVFVGASES